MKVLHVVGARPNFMKVAPVLAQLRERRQVRQVLVHTGQHYEVKMSEVFFQDLGMPQPDLDLGVGSGSHAQQTAKVMIEVEPVLAREKPDVVVVAGDVNSTVAVALVAAKMGIPVAHIEAGLRSRDWSMPEEINRELTDRLSDLLFTPSRDADENLRGEGIDPARVHFVGNVMIDSLRAALPRARESRIQERLELSGNGYALATLHRPANVDDPQALARLPAGFERRGLKLVEPLGYVDFLALMVDARLVMTDSGGIQEETTALGVPCLTLRENTERPITVQVGTNRLVGSDPARAVSAAREVLASRIRAGGMPELWTAARPSG